MKCPLCEGKGTVNTPDCVDKTKRRAMARKMRKLGFTFSVIMKALGYKSPRSVSIALERKD